MNQHLSFIRLDEGIGKFVPTVEIFYIPYQVFVDLVFLWLKSDFVKNNRKILDRKSRIKEGNYEL